MSEGAAVAVVDASGDTDTLGVTEAVAIEVADGEGDLLGVAESAAVAVGVLEAAAVSAGEVVAVVVWVGCGSRSAQVKPREPLTRVQRCTRQLLRRNGVLIHDRRTEKRKRPHLLGQLV